MNILLIVFLSVGVAVVCWSWWRGIRAPAAPFPEQIKAAEALAAEYQAVFNQEQLEMAAHMGKLVQAGHFAEGAMLIDRLVPVLADHNSEVYVQLLLIKAECLIKQNRVDQAEALCFDYVQQDVSQERKVKMLDGAASYMLYQSSSTFLALAEKLARMGLDIAPGSLTLKGTLGSLLAEQGNYVAAEQLLRECLERSPSLTDQAISTFYLGMIKIRTGEAKEGKRLIKRGMKMYPEAWMVAKGNGL